MQDDRGAGLGGAMKRGSALCTWEGAPLGTWGGGSDLWLLGCLWLLPAAHRQGGGDGNSCQDNCMVWEVEGGGGGWKLGAANTGWS